jgi:hypothetical protein
MLKPIRFDPEADIIDIRFDKTFKAVFTRESPSSCGALREPQGKPSTGSGQALGEKKVLSGA